MTRYHMFMFDMDQDAKCADFYSTDAGLLSFLASDLITRFGASQVDSGEIAQTGEMAVYFKGVLDLRQVEHYINQLLCSNGWEPYDDYRFRMRCEG